MSLRVASRSLLSSLTFFSKAPTLRARKARVFSSEVIGITRLFSLALITHGRLGSLESIDAAEQGGHVFDAQVTGIDSAIGTDELNDLNTQDTQGGTDVGAHGVGLLLDDEADLGALADITQHSGLDGSAFAVHEYGGGLFLAGAVTLAVGVLAGTFLIPGLDGLLDAALGLGLGPLQQFLAIALGLSQDASGELVAKGAVVELAAVLVDVDVALENCVENVAVVSHGVWCGDGCGCDQ